MDFLSVCELSASFAEPLPNQGKIARPHHFVSNANKVFCSNEFGAVLKLRDQKYCVIVRCMDSTSACMTVGVLKKGQVAQSVEQRTENPCVGGSIPPLATNHLS